MEFSQLVQAALELGVIPALALFLVAAMYLQNKQLQRDRQQMEERLLTLMSEVVRENQKAMTRLATNQRELPPAMRADEDQV